MKFRVDAIITSTLVICALITTGLVVRHEFVASHETRSAEPRPLFVKEWRADAETGVLIGRAAAPVQLVEFADFECPFCASFHATFRRLREKYPSQLSLTYVEFPLPMHRFAEPAARVAECADIQGRFEAMYDQLFDGQESFGRKPWSDYATAAGVPDLAAFDLCIKSTDSVKRIEEGKQLGAKLDVKGTPTVIVNGWILSHPPTPEELEVMVQAVLAGKSPVSDRT